MTPDAAPGEITDLVTKEWSAYVEQWLPLAERTFQYLDDPEDSQRRQELYRSLVIELAVGYFALLWADPSRPDFYPFTNPGFNAYLNNPDDDYYQCPLADDGVYKIWGYRGTVKTIDFQTGGGSFLRTGVRDENNLGVTCANYDLDLHATVGEDGWFEVILSRERPDGWDGDWWELHEGATNIFVRQISYDWENEIDGRLGIERVDLPAARPLPTTEEIQAGMNGLADWVEGSMKASADFVVFIRTKIGINVLDYWDLESHLAIPTQAYVYGGYELEDDEALVIEFQVPKEVRYWSFHLGNDLGWIHEWQNHHTMVNGHYAHVGPDRTCHFVVSARDPGVPNWLDTIGYRTGCLSLRWEGCDAYPAEHKVEKVKFEDAAGLLPDDLPRITPEERDQMIRKRRLGVQMRKKW